MTVKVSAIRMMTIHVFSKFNTILLLAMISVTWRSGNVQAEREGTERGAMLMASSNSVLRVNQTIEISRNV